MDVQYNIEPVVNCHLFHSELYIENQFWQEVQENVSMYSRPLFWFFFSSLLNLVRDTHEWITLQDFFLENVFVIRDQEAKMAKNSTFEAVKVNFLELWFYILAQFTQILICDGQNVQKLPVDNVLPM